MCQRSADEVRQNVPDSQMDEFSHCFHCGGSKSRDQSSGDADGGLEEEEEEEERRKGGSGRCACVRRDVLQD